MPKLVYRVVGLLSCAAAIIGVALPVRAEDHAGHHAHDAQVGHDHQQHGHAKVVRFGTVWEAGIDVTDWQKPTKACSLHPQIVSNKPGATCPITAGVPINQATKVPAGAARRLGLILLPLNGPKTPIGDAVVSARWSNGQKQLQRKDGYYWIDLPKGTTGAVTIEVSRGGERHSARID